MEDMSKKIGILTFSYSSNPGSVLQAYALQETISTIPGLKGSIINYQKTGADKPIIGYNVFNGPIKHWSLNKMGRWVKRLIAYPLRMHKYECFFRNYYKGFRREPYRREELSRTQQQYDKYVVGSDQVWNFDSINTDNTYLLDFVKDSSKKVSYAASFGQRGVPQEYSDAAAKLIKDFAAISVREQSGVQTVSELTGREAEWVLDPSLLRSKEQWEEMEIAPKQKDYVLVYLRHQSDVADQYARKLAEQHNLKIIKVDLHWLCNNEGKRVRAIGPREWIGYVNHARYVVTNSFHGICFSLALEKEVYVAMLSGTRMETNPRLSSLLNLFGIEDRCIDTEHSTTSTSAMDYDRINKIKETWQAKSLAYLKQALTGENQNGKTND